MVVILLHYYNNIIDHCKNLHAYVSLVIVVFYSSLCVPVIVHNVM